MRTFWFRFTNPDGTPNGSIGLATAWDGHELREAIGGIGDISRVQLFRAKSCNTGAICIHPEGASTGCPDPMAKAGRYTGWLIPQWPKIKDDKWGGL